MCGQTVVASEIKLEEVGSQLQGTRRAASLARLWRIFTCAQLVTGQTSSFHHDRTPSVAIIDFYSPACDGVPAAKWRSNRHRRHAREVSALPVQAGWVRHQQRHLEEGEARTHSRISIKS